jgi:hypothetical protein
MSFEGWAMMPSISGAKALERGHDVDGDLCERCNERLTNDEELVSGVCDRCILNGAVLTESDFDEIELAALFSLEDDEDEW